MKGFKNFIMRGNLIDTAVAFIIGVAFGAVVTSFTQIVLDLLGKLGGTPNFSGWTPGGVHVGSFLTALISFLVVAAVVYFAIVAPITKLRERRPEAEKSASETELLAEIRDLLAAQRQPGTERLESGAIPSAYPHETGEHARRPISE